MRAAIYARVSTEEQAQGYSIDAQLRACRERAGEDAQVYVEEGKSARTEDIRKRPVFRQLLADAEAGRFDCIIVHKLDRFSRNLRITLEAFERLARANVSFISITEQIDYTTPHGKLFLHMLAALAQWFSDNLSQETKKGKAERKRQGLYNGLLPFGYAKGPDGLPMPHSTNHAGLLLAFQAAAEGMSDAEVARRLNAAGYRTSGNRGSNLWTKDSVRVMLTNRFYLGELPGGIPGKHPALIDSDLFDRAQRAREHNRKRSALKVGIEQHVYSLSGLLRCGYCGGSIRIHARNGEKPRTRCYSRSQGLDCSQRSRWLSVYEEQIDVWLQQIEPMNVEDRLAKLAKRSQPDECAEERRRLETRLANIKELFAWGDITREQYVAERDMLTARLQQIEAPSKDQQNLREFAELVGRASWIWQHGMPQEQNELLCQLVKQIVIKDGAITEIELQPDAAPLLPHWIAPVHRSGSDGERISLGARYAEARDNLPRPFLEIIADTAATTSIRATSRRFGVSRQTVRRAMAGPGRRREGWDRTTRLSSSQPSCCQTNTPVLG